MINNKNIFKNKIKKGIITTIAGTGVQGFNGNGDGGNPLNANLNYPHSLVYDFSSKNIFFSDCYDHRIKVLSIV